MSKNLAHGFASFTLALVVTACQQKTSELELSDKNRPRVESGASQFDLTAEKLAESKALAIKGDVAAAIRVSNYYIFVMNDSESAKPWIQIAAERGDLSSMIDLAQLLSEENTTSSCSGALFWLSRAESEAKNSRPDLQELAGQLLKRQQAKVANCKG